MSSLAQSSNILLVTNKRAIQIAAVAMAPENRVETVKGAVYFMMGVINNSLLLFLQSKIFTYLHI